MVAVTANETMLLKDVELFLEPVEIYDGNGKLLGLYVPANLERGKEMSKQPSALVDWAELEREARSGEEGEPFERVLDRLNRLAAEVERRRSTGERELTEQEALAFIDRLRQQDKSPRAQTDLEKSGAEKDACATP